MKLDQASTEYIDYVQDQQRKEVLRKQERKEKLKEKYAKYRLSIEEYVDKMIRNNYSSYCIYVDLLTLAEEIDCEDLITDSTGKIFLTHYDLGEYVALLYQENGFTTELRNKIRDRGFTYGDNCICISGWR